MRIRCTAKRDGWKGTRRRPRLYKLPLVSVLAFVCCYAAKGHARQTNSWTEPATPKYQETSLSVSPRRREHSRTTAVPKKTPSPDAEKAARAEELRRRRIFRTSLRIKGLRGAGHIDLFVENLTAHTVTITMDITCKNMESTEELPLTTVVAAKQSKKVTRLSPIDESSPYRYRYKVDMLPGKAKAVPDKDHVYALPYRTGTAHWVVQGYGGKFTHQGRSRYSIDFAMPEGTPIYAARGGVVAEIKFDSNESGASEAYRDLANYIIIEHADGTWAEYYHLKEDGVKVEVDEEVEVGKIIGYSGNTGYSKIPHLHFAVRKTISGKVSSTIPVKLKTSRGVLSRLKPNRPYRAVDLLTE